MSSKFYVTMYKVTYRIYLCASVYILSYSEFRDRSDLRFLFAPLHITNIVLIVDIGSYFYVLYRDSCGMRHPVNSILSGM